MQPVRREPSAHRVVRARPVSLALRKPTAKCIGVSLTRQPQLDFPSERVEWQDSGPATSGITPAVDDVVVNKTGDYDASFFVSAESSSAFQLTLDGATIPGSTYASQQSGINAITGSVIFHAIAGGTVELTAAGFDISQLESAADGAVTVSLTASRLS